jgi:hypothetical protein
VGGGQHVWRQAPLHVPPQSSPSTLAASSFTQSSRPCPGGRFRVGLESDCNDNLVQLEIEHDLVPMAPSQATAARHSAYYCASIDEFLAASSTDILGALTHSSAGAIDQTQVNAWEAEVDLLKAALPGITGTILLEFDVPRIGSRIDAVLISGSVIFPLEFKIGQSSYLRQDIDQVWDYALDLKNFHSGSQASPIVPILVASEAPGVGAILPEPHGDLVSPPALCGRDGLRELLLTGLGSLKGPPLDGVTWAGAPYRPTPTIIQAAQAMYAGHSVEAIARHEAGVRNLHETSQCIEHVIDEARATGTKAIVFVTGVPGAGKTLVGLNIATMRRDSAQPTHAVFLSGNGPLVAVLREALTRDGFARRKGRGQTVRKGEVAQEVKAFIQNVHHFRDEGLRDVLPPIDHVVIFDEAQRAWNLQKTAKFMQQRKKRPGFSQSEPEFLLSYLNRHPDWAVVVCLVGGGQEINEGEAGISAWLEAVRYHFPEWSVYISPELTDSEYAAGHALEALTGRAHVVKEPTLHLGVSVRSFRAESVSRFVKAVLDCDRMTASQLLESMRGKYPVVLTRDLDQAKRWIRAQARGTERYGLVTSSGAERLKPLAIDVRVDVDPVQWFLNAPDDTRSSYYLEDAATEFQVQGLELDWSCVSWDADLRSAGNSWNYHSFHGSRWKNILASERRQYLLNAYRVLLTRARQGMVIVVPDGEASDPTRNPVFYDGTFEYLAGIGIPILDA